ncbi:MAG: hydantoinase/oxoprolinase N-terminal domain-containing protein, partial [Oleiphilaceae bacterium]|nr:hydantoinase/oxoprolinase N-terminal domain-containing protein [Oleiphilaceae bacterium]
MSTKQAFSRNYLGIDAGGTFTDFVYFGPSGLGVHKVLSTPDDPAQAILQGICEMGLMDEAQQGKLKIVHGSTVATNAALERKGVKTAYITNRGLKDVLTIGRQARTRLYDLNPPVPEPPVPRHLCLEVNTRRDSEGHLLTALTDQDIAIIKAQLAQLKPESVAINLLFSFLNDSEERRLEEALSEHYFTSRSSMVLPVYKEYERGIATWLNASLGPKVNAYLNRLAEALPPQHITMMQSSGGTIPIVEASRRAVNLLLSGPAGGLAALRHFGRLIEHNKLISF